MSVRNRYPYFNPISRAAKSAEAGRSTTMCAAPKNGMMPSILDASRTRRCVDGLGPLSAEKKMPLGIEMGCIVALVTLDMSEKTSGIEEKIDVCRDGGMEFAIEDVRGRQMRIWPKMQEYQSDELALFDHEIEDHGGLAAFTSALHVGNHALKNKLWALCCGGNWQEGGRLFGSAKEKKGNLALKRGKGHNTERLRAGLFGKVWPLARKRGDMTKNAWLLSVAT